MEIVYFYENFFRFTKLFLPSWPCRFFSKYFYTILGDFFNWSSLLNNSLVRFFCGENFTSKKFRELYLVELHFNIRQGFSLQPRTLLNSITYDFMRALEKAAPKTLENSERKTYVVEFVIELHKYSLQPTVGLIHSGSAQKEKDVLKIWKSKKIFAKLLLFFLMLQPCSPKFLTSANTSSNENVSFEYSEIAGRKSYNEVIWSTKHF